MKATPAQQLRLLELQSLDTTLARLQRRRKQLPERAPLAALQGDLATAKNQYMTVQRELDVQSADIARVEDDVETVRARRERDDQLLTATSSSKEIQALQSELETLLRRQSELEDRQLELMEVNEATQARMVEASEQLAGIDTRREELTTAIVESEQLIDAETALTREERAGLAAEIQRDLLEIYEETRARTGIGAARLRGNVSEGSNMALAPSELSGIRAAALDEIIFCPGSGAILIREFE